MIHTLIILACLAAEPTDCRTYEQPVSGLSAVPTMLIRKSPIGDR